MRLETSFLREECSQPPVVTAAGRFKRMAEALLNKMWLLSFMRYELGSFDSESGRVERAPNPFDAEVSAVPAMRDFLGFIKRKV